MFTLRFDIRLSQGDAAAIDRCEWVETRGAVIAVPPGIRLKRWEKSA